ncbi:MAG TPA: type II secretion system secretin GspD [Rhizobiaceae bacterium]|nr:type II secretion system secretin GspD [Rhizobiaceae bacterium]
MTSCNSTYLEETAQRPDPLDKVRNADLSARDPKGGGFFSRMGFGGGNERRRGGAVYYGAETTLTTGERRSLERLRGEEFEVNLENADISVAARSVLGEVLGISYTLDERATGRVSIITSRPTPAEDILRMFEGSLRANGVVMVREGDRLRLMPATEALGVAELDQNVTISPGYGVTVLPLRHVSASTVLPLLENFVARSGMVREDPGRNALIFQGTAQERGAAIEAAKSFDQDWLKDQSVGIFPVQNSSASAMMPELSRVLDLGQGGRGSNTIRVQPIDRSNSLLVVAKSRTMLQRAATWIERLDGAAASASNLRVYQVQHVDARRLAGMVNEIFLGEASTGEDPGAQFPPDAEPGIQQASALSGVDASPGNLAQRMADEFPRTDQAPITGGSPIGGGSSGGQRSAEGVRITANPDNNTLLIYARPDQQRLVEQAIAALDRPSAQVAIEATIAEVSLTNDLRYGVQFFLKNNSGSIGNFRSTTTAAIGRVLPGFNLLIGPETDPRVVLDALRGITEVKVLSSPSVVVMDNKPATLQVGDEVPIVTRTAQSVTNPDAPVVNNVEFRDTGVILRVLPRITANGTINLKIEQEISAVLGGAQSLTPTISQRKVDSTVAVSSGQTVLLGGLISEKQDKGRSGIPVLGEIPVIGGAFRNTTNYATRTELIVMIRAQVIRDTYDAQTVAEQMRSQLRIMNTPSRPLPLPRPVNTLIE